MPSMWTKVEWMWLGILLATYKATGDYESPSSRRGEKRADELGPVTEAIAEKTWFWVKQRQLATPASMRMLDDYLRDEEQRTSRFPGLAGGARDTLSGAW